MDTVLFFALAGAYVLLVVWGVLLAARYGWATPANLPLLVIAGLVYDNAVLASGRYIDEGPLLEMLSYGRFWLHAFLTPLLVIWSWHAVCRAGAPWAARRSAAVVAMLVTGALVVLELITEVAGLELTAGVEYGVLSYSNAEATQGPPLMVLFIAAALLVAGFVLWRRQRWLWLLVGAGLMVVGSAVPVPIESGATTNLFELALLVSVMATKVHQDRSDHPRASSVTTA